MKFMEQVSGKVLPSSHDRLNVNYEGTVKVMQLKFDLNIPSTVSEIICNSNFLKPYFYHHH
jgi:hypothetical protein